MSFHPRSSAGGGDHEGRPGWPGPRGFGDGLNEGAGYGAVAVAAVHRGIYLVHRHIRGTTDFADVADEVSDGTAPRPKVFVARIIEVNDGEGEMGPAPEHGLGQAKEVVIDLESGPGPDPSQQQLDQLPAARYRSTTSALMRPRGETSIPRPAAQARTAAGS